MVEALLRTCPKLPAETVSTGLCKGACKFSHVTIRWSSGCTSSWSTSLSSSSAACARYGSCWLSLQPPWMISSLQVRKGNNLSSCHCFIEIDCCLWQTSFLLECLLTVPIWGVLMVQNWNGINALWHEATCLARGHGKSSNAHLDSAQTFPDDVHEHCKCALNF